MMLMFPERRVILCLSTPADAADLVEMEIMYMKVTCATNTA